MASNTNCGLILLSLYVILHLCTGDTLDDTDKYPTIEKRIFCNPAGCRNIHGKRNYANRRKYNMFNRIRTGKRASEAALYDNYDPLTSESVQSAYDAWPSEQISLDKSLTDGLSNTHNSNDIQLYDGDDIGDNRDDSKHVNSNYDLDIAMLNLYERYKILRDAEEIVHYMRSNINKENPKKQSRKRRFNSWLERRK